jgi:hypothetical protein
MNKGCKCRFCGPLIIDILCEIKQLINGTEGFPEMYLILKDDFHLGNSLFLKNYLYNPIFCIKKTLTLKK